MSECVVDEEIKRILSKRVDELTEEDKKLLIKWMLAHRTHKSVALDLNFASKRVPVFVKTWIKKYGKIYDIPGVDTPDALLKAYELGFKPRSRTKLYRRLTRIMREKVVEQKQVYETVENKLNKIIREYEEAEKKEKENKEITRKITKKLCKLGNIVVSLRTYLSNEDFKKIIRIIKYINKIAELNDFRVYDKDEHRTYLSFRLFYFDEYTKSRGLRRLIGLALGLKMLRDFGDKIVFYDVEDAERWKGMYVVDKYMKITIDDIEKQVKEIIETMRKYNDVLIKDGIKYGFNKYYFYDYYLIGDIRHKIPYFEVPRAEKIIENKLGRKPFVEFFYGKLVDIIKKIIDEKKYDRVSNLLLKILYYGSKYGVVYLGNISEKDLYDIIRFLDSNGVYLGLLSGDKQVVNKLREYIDRTSDIMIVYKPNREMLHNVLRFLSNGRVVIFANIDNCKEIKYLVEKILDINR